MLNVKLAISTVTGVPVPRLQIVEAMWRIAVISNPEKCSFLTLSSTAATSRGMTRAQPLTLFSDFPFIDPWFEPHYLNVWLMRKGLQPGWPIRFEGVASATPGRCWFLLEVNLKRKLRSVIFYWNTWKVLPPKTSQNNLDRSNWTWMTCKLMNGVANSYGNVW